MRRLGAGGMGEVSLARQRMAGGLERVVVLKTMLPHIATSRANVDLFLREARLAASLSHPNIVQIHDVTEHEGRPCIVMEYLRGADLSLVQRRAIRSGAWLTVFEALAIAAQASDGLDHAHAHVDEQDRPRSIVHRDISPQNLLVVRDGTVKILDFGIARAMDDPRTQTGVLRGKLAYMAPEQLDGASGRPVGPAVDQFALGVVLWECLTRKRLFHRGTPIETIRAVGELVVPPPSALAGCPKGLDPVVLRALARDPSARFPSCAALAHELRGALAALTRRPEKAIVADLLARCVGELVSPPRGNDRETEVTEERPAEPTFQLEDAELEEDDPTQQLPIYEPATVLLSTPPASSATASAGPRSRLAPAAAIVAGVLLVAAGVWAALSVHAPPLSPTSDEPPAARALEPSVAPPATSGPIVHVRFDGVPAGAQIHVDGAPLSGAVFVGPASDEPRELRITIGEREVWASRRALAGDETIALAIASPPTAPHDPPPSRVAPPTTTHDVPTRPHTRLRRDPGAGLVRDYPAE